MFNPALMCDIKCDHLPRYIVIVFIISVRSHKIKVHVSNNNFNTGSM